MGNVESEIAGGNEPTESKKSSAVMRMATINKNVSKSPSVRKPVARRMASINKAVTYMRAVDDRHSKRVTGHGSSTIKEKTIDDTTTLVMATSQKCIVGSHKLRFGYMSTNSGHVICLDHMHEHYIDPKRKGITPSDVVTFNLISSNKWVQFTPPV
jgi:hypothetical protein